MKLLCLPALLLLLGCGDSNANKKKGENSTDQGVPETTVNQQAGIVGEWEQQYTAFDKNGNNILDPEEKKPSGTRLGFNWFKFSADGNCLRDRDLKFEGTYEIQEKNGTKKLVIKGGDELRYTIADLTGKELTLGANGAFIIFRRVN